VDRAEVLPGDLLQISWQIEGAVDRLKKLELTFVGEEAATYRRGTSSHTDRHEFQKIPVYQTEMIGPIGAASLRIPEDAMHSFKAPNNVIAWKLKFHGDVPRWPDVDVDYEIVVIPRGAPRD
jgi:hypothetical protein